MIIFFNYNKTERIKHQLTHFILFKNEKITYFEETRAFMSLSNFHNRIKKKKKNRYILIVINTGYLYNII